MGIEAEGGMSPEAQRIAVANLLPSLLHVEESGVVGRTLDEALMNPTKTVILWKDTELIRDWYPVRERDWYFILHEAEKVLTHDQCTSYHETLDMLHASDTTERNGEQDYPAQDFWFHATAAQRTEAILRTLNLWDDTK